ncbi:sodium-coupled monocarboxylate transporter 2-like [Zophobas morio]
MAFLAIFVYLPVFFKLQITNIYEYLERRFDRRTRILAFVLYVLSDILMFPILAYPPALTFATASGINSTLCAFILCSICLFYTSIGGLKTVVWTDFVQFGVIMVTLVTIFAIGVNGSDGFVSVWNTASAGGRLEVFNFNLDFTARDGFWGYFIACGTTSTAVIIVHPTGIQKFLSLSKYKDCVWSVIHTTISMCVFHTFCILIGLVVYYKYKDCDPLTSHIVSKHDQVFPYFVTEIGSSVPGVSGLFIAAVCSAALSTMSSNLNALSGVIYKDVVCPFLKNTPSEKTGSDILKLTVLIVGFLCTCLVFLVERMGQIFSISLTVWGITQGPIFGAFTLGVLFPKANRKGALYGMIGGFISIACLSIPAKYFQMQGLLTYATKPLSTSGCIFYNQTLLSNNTTSQISFQPPTIFKISFFNYTFLGAAMTVIYGVIISFFTKSDTRVDKKLLSPVTYFCLCKKTQDGDGAGYFNVDEALERLN